MKSILKNNKSLNTIAQELSEVAGYLWQRGWAERNAGNISIHISETIEEEIPIEGCPYFDLPDSYAALGGKYFLVTGTGKRMRDLSKNLINNSLIIRLNKAGKGYYIVSQKKENENLMPTSELPTHLAIHQMVAKRGSNEQVVMHTHATELITLTQAREFCNGDSLNKLLWGMHPETIVFVPKGVGFVPYNLPGTTEIATETLKVLTNYDVAIWEKHGVFAIGKTITGTFDVIDILAKSAKIFFMCRSAGMVPSGLTEEQLVELKKLSNNF